MNDLRHWSAHLPVGAPDGFDLPHPGTLAGAWTAALGAEPDRPLLWGSIGGGPARWVARGEFLDRTERLAARLAGDKVFGFSIAIIKNCHRDFSITIF